MAYKDNFVEGDLRHLERAVEIGRLDALALERVRLAFKSDPSRVTWLRSSFEDPGTDWNEVQLDGEAIYRSEGY
jgi:hypothetical protein